ncbi:hypothetical protein WFK62_12425 [Yersinia enterocolitica]|uniref:RipA family octameric membrane protein n=1 Tax=Yersinia enterocolitica TaxID=630 RepID=UPI0028DA1ADD|nr:hypothetical protein [Yersinia enterocolitica]EKN3585932.1 hypothetical protein [Yersinia enterocolitica]EKN3768626.1 hypothetical protein [Yersinia enterocolitica]EKN4083254.1 hypothetical protein [Yersinia enterocolitica]EKN6166843.1 hypothetical protein [Yersinia enterocolitica]
MLKLEDSNKEEKPKEIIEIDDNDGFFSKVFGEHTKTIEVDSYKHKKLILALEKAHEIRKFEIELYWKRATYFFAFFTIITAAFGYLFTHEKYSIYSPAAAIVGVIFSIFFYHINIGSKYWQQNWEFVIDKLEFYVTGNIYKVFFYENLRDQRPSVSSINGQVSVFIFILWYLCFITSLVKISTLNPIYMILYLIFGICFCVYFHVKCLKSVCSVIIKKNGEARYYEIREPVTSPSKKV